MPAAFTEKNHMANFLKSAFQGAAAQLFVSTACTAGGYALDGQTGAAIGLLAVSIAGAIVGKQGAAAFNTHAAVMSHETRAHHTAIGLGVTVAGAIGIACSLALHH